MLVTEIFRCPKCGGDLTLKDGALISPGCGALFPLQDGIPLFVPADDFYEGKFVAPTQNGVGWTSGAGRFIDLCYERFSSTRIKHFFTKTVLKRFDPDALILDVGCGGGNNLLASYQTVGVDLSFAGLRNAAGIYQAVATADARALPFADHTFDLINSWDVFGHIPVEQKDDVIGQWRRVLKPGGTMLHIIEADCTAPFCRLVKRDRALYRKYFIDLDGHYGLELPADITRRFQRAGFRVEKTWSYFRAGIFPPEEYAKRLAAGTGYAESSRTLKTLAGFGSVCSRHKQLDRVMSLGTGVLGRAFNPLLPMNWGSTFFIVCRKP